MLPGNVARRAALRWCSTASVANILTARRGAPFRQQHRDRVGLFARRAGRHPDTDRLTTFGIFDQRRDHFAIESLPRLVVAKERGYVNQQILDEGSSLIWVFCQPREIVVQLFHLHETHPAMDTAR